MMVAQVCGYQAGDFIHTFGDAHIYTNHQEQIATQLERTPKPLPQMKLNAEIKDLLEFSYDDFELIGYDPHPLIRGKVAV
jgi:thymidylate synthase